MDIQIFEGAGEVAEEAAARVIARVGERPDAVLAVPTGRTPVEMYQRLVDAHRSGAVDLGQVRWFALDEFHGVPPDHPESFRGWLMEHLIHPAGLDPRRLDTMRGDVPDPDAEAAAYEEKIRAAGGLDLVILGLGRNGHLAFNEPGTPEDSTTGVRCLTDGTREANQYLFPQEDAPTRGLSMGLGTIATAKALLLMATGASKSDAVRAMVRAETPVEACPAALLRDHRDATVLLDREAAAALGEVT